MPDARTAPPASAPSWTATAPDAGVRLDKFLALPARLGSRGRATDALRRGRVFLNGEEASVRDSGRTLRAGDRIQVWEDRPGSALARRDRLRSGLPILYEDAEIIVLNKPVGLLAVPLEERRDDDSAFDHIEDHLRSQGKRRPLVVHRIDRDTSGVVVFAKTSAALAALKQQFLRREPERVYWAVVYGHPSPPEGTWQNRLVWDPRAMIQKATHPSDPSGTDARCHYRVLEQFPGASLVEVRLETGRRNQIRLQARLHGHTLVGERRYVYGPDTLRPIPFPRQALHAHHLTFRHPRTGAPLTCTAPLPHDMTVLLATLRREGRREARAAADAQASPRDVAPPRERRPSNDTDGTPGRRPVATRRPDRHGPGRAAPAGRRRER